MNKGGGQFLPPTGTWRSCPRRVSPPSPCDSCSSTACSTVAYGRKAQRHKPASQPRQVLLQAEESAVIIYIFSTKCRTLMTTGCVVLSSQRGSATTQLAPPPHTPWGCTRGGRTATRVCPSPRCSGASELVVRHIITILQVQVERRKRASSSFIRFLLKAGALLLKPGALSILGSSQ